MADLSALGTLNPVQPLDLDLYPDTRSGFQLPKAGKYTVLAPESFTFGRTQAGDLSVEVSPKIIGPTNEGFQLRFVKVSAKQYDRDGRPASQLGDYLRAFGFRGTLNSEQDIADAVETTAGRSYEVILDWEARKGDFKVKGMRNFPADGQGGYQNWVNHPTDRDPETGSPLRLRANVVVTKFVPMAG